MPIPSQCASLEDEINGLKQARSDLQEELSTAATGAKARLVMQIKRISALIAAKQPALDACIIEYGGGPVPQPIATSLVGMMSFVTDRNLSGEPYSADLAWGLMFDGGRTQVSTIAFPELHIDTTALADQVAGFWKFLFGPNITTISLKDGGAGSFSKSTGSLVVPMRFYFDHSRDVPFVVEDSYLAVNLSTENSGGSRLGGNGRISLSGSGCSPKESSMASGVP